MTSDTETSDNDLHSAVRFCDINDVKEALKCKLSPNKIGLYKWTPLHEASSMGYADMVKLLLQYGGNPNLPDKLCRNTAMHYAAQEGHSTCLSLLLDAGGDYTLTNQYQESVLDVATKACERVIEKKRVQQLIKLPSIKAKEDAINDFNRKEIKDSKQRDPVATAHTNAEKDNPDAIVKLNDITGSSQPRLAAWAPKYSSITQPLDSMGQLHISFEYHSKKNSLKVRLWKLTGLMFSNTHSVMINTLYVKSSLIPLMLKDTKRRSEEIKVASLLRGLNADGSTSKRATSQSFITDTGSEVIFQHVTFKFSKPLVYEGITCQTVRDKAIYIQVCVKQKYTRKTYTIADLSMPLSGAVTKLVKEPFTLRMYKEMSLPDNMMILPELKNVASTASDPNLRVVSPCLAPKLSLRPASDVNLREVVSLCSHSTSVSIDIPSEDEAETTNEQLSQICVGERYSNLSSSMVIAMPNEITEPNSDDGLQSIQTDIQQEPQPQSTSSDIRITVTNNDSDSSDLDQSNTNILSNFNKLLNKVKRGNKDRVELIERGEIPLQAINNASYMPSLTDISDRKPIATQTRTKLKPKIPQPIKSSDVALFGDTYRSASPSLRGSDVIVSIDMELEDLDTIAPVHQIADEPETDVANNQALNRKFSDYLRLA